MVFMLLERLVHAQRGFFACTENADAIEHLKDALMVMQERTRRRQEQGVEGRNLRHESGEERSVGIRQKYLEARKARDRYRKARDRAREELNDTAKHRDALLKENGDLQRENEELFIELELTR